MSQNVDEGLALLRGAAQKRPDDFTIRQRLVEACVRTGRSDEAVSEFAALVKATPDFSQVHFDALARTRIPAQIANLCSAFERATKAALTDAVAWYGLGLARQLANDQDGAADAFKAGIKVDRYFGPLHYNLGVALMDKPLQAELVLDEATRCSPNLAEPHYALGTLYEASDKLRSAHHFREFIRLAPSHLRANVEDAQRIIKMLESL